jgi:DNA-binding IclR family transcriptional regulator
MANSTLEHGLELLTWLAERGGLHTLTEISSTFGWPKSHVHRLLQSLIHMKFCHQEENGKRYGAGLKVLELSHVLLSQISLRSMALPTIQKLANDLDSDVFITLPYENKALIITSAYPHGDQRHPSSTIGTPLSPERTVSGALIAAHLGISNPHMEKLTFECAPQSTLPFQVIRRLEDLKGMPLDAVAMTLMEEDRLNAVLGVNLNLATVAKMGESIVLHQIADCTDRLQRSLERSEHER